MPRRDNTKYLADSAACNQGSNARKKLGEHAVIKLDELKAISDLSGTEYPQEMTVICRPRIRSSTNSRRYTAWLRDNSVVGAAQGVLKVEPEDLIEAGYPESQTKAFLDAYHALEQAESSSPGHVVPEALRLHYYSRELGEAVNPTTLPTTR